MLQSMVLINGDSPAGCRNETIRKMTAESFENVGNVGSVGFAVRLLNSVSSASVQSSAAFGKSD